MTKLKELSVSELHQRIKDATDELIAREIEEVKPLMTEKRVAEVGEKVVVVNPFNSRGVYSKGDVFTVQEVLSFVVSVEEQNQGLLHSEYEVLVEEESREANAAKALVSTLQSLATTSANQQRAELIQRAREFVESAKKCRYGEMVYVTNCPSGYWCDAEFIVNEEKRTVVALLRTTGGWIQAKGIAKCMPGEVFNKWIGMAIALARALEIDIPEEFLDAVQPDEVVVGMVVYDEKTWHFSKYKTVVNTFPGNGQCRVGSTSAQRAEIINDSEAVYSND